MTPKFLGLLPASVLHAGWYGVLATIVALNTLAYVALALVKLFPALHAGEWFHSRERRAEERSIHPDSIVAHRGRQVGLPTDPDAIGQRVQRSE